MLDNLALQPWRGELALRVAGGKTLPVAVRAEAVPSRDGALLGFIITLNDLRENKRAGAARLHLAEALQVAARGGAGAAPRDADEVIAAILSNASLAAMCRWCSSSNSSTCQRNALQASATTASISSAPSGISAKPTRKAPRRGHLLALTKFVESGAKVLRQAVLPRDQAFERLATVQITQTTHISVGHQTARGFRIEFAQTRHILLRGALERKRLMLGQSVQIGRLAG